MLPEAVGAMKMRPLRSLRVPLPSAPAASSARHSSKWPWNTAQCSGVRFHRSSQSLRAEPHHDFKYNYIYLFIYLHYIIKYLKMWFKM